MESPSLIRRLRNPAWWSGEFAVRTFPLLRALATSERAVPVLNRVLAPYNPFNSERTLDPYAIYEQLRQAGPVFRHPRLLHWVVSGREEAELVFRAESTVNRSAMMRRISPYKDLRPDVLEVATTIMLLADPPDHTRLRRLVNRAFTPRTINQLEPEVHKLAQELLDDLAGQPQFDAMSAYASQLPIYVIGELMGLPKETWPKLKAISDVAALLVEPLKSFDPLAMEQALDDFNEILDVELEARRVQPRDDLLTVLASAAEDGDRLTRSELQGMCILLMVAGHETTSGLIGNALIALDQHRHARQTLLDHPELAANAVEELLRYDSPVQGTDRVILEALDVGGFRIPAGSSVEVVIGAANRDPIFYDAPDELRLDRPDPRPLSFGHGIHHCLGAALARLEARVAIPAFVQRFPDYEVDHANVVQKQSVTLRGPAVLPVIAHERVLTT